MKLNAMALASKSLFVTWATCPKEEPATGIALSASGRRFVQKAEIIW